MSSPQLHALVVGINKYKHLPPSKWLNNCHRDADRMRDFLASPDVKAQFESVNIREMKESMENVADIPDKDNMIAAFREHLGKAKPGDTALFFYAGHGVRETTDIQSFSEQELDGQIGGLAVHDFGDKEKKNPGGTVVADKEIRYLIKELADKGTEENPIHIVVVFDCCHSGESTRSVLGDEMPAKSRQLERGPVGQRTIEEFFFCKDENIKQQLQAGKDLDEILPQGNHIMLAACREIELAWEGSAGGGVFTAGLVDVLEKHNGDITYQELHNRVLSRMRFVEMGEDTSDFRQTPQLYLNTDKMSDRYRKFLTNKQSEKPTYGALEYNEDEEELRMDIGALHGVPVDSDGPVKVKIYQVGKEDDALIANVLDIFPTHCTLDPSELNLDKFKSTPDSKPWRGKLNGVDLPKLKIAITGEASGVAIAKQVIEAGIAESANSNIALVSESDDPDYVLYADGTTFQIRETGVRALARVAATVYKGKDEEGNVADPKDAATVQYEFLKQMADWHRLKDLDHNGEFFPDDERYDHPEYPVQLKIYEYDPATKTEKILPHNAKAFTIDLTEKKPNKYVRFELINRTDKDLFVSLTWMTHTYGFLTKGKFVLMHKAQLGLGPMTEPSMELGEGHVQSSRLGKRMPNGKRYMIFGSGGYIETDNWTGQQDYLKLLVSEAQFDLESLNMPWLPGPGEKVGKQTRYAAIATDDEKPIPKWELSTWSMFITNPVYQPPVIA